MKPFIFKSIHTRLTFWFLLISLIPLLIALSITFYQRLKVLETNEFNKLTAIRDLKVQQLSNWISERQADVETMSETLELRNIESVLAKKEKSGEDIQKTDAVIALFNRYIKNYNDYSEIFLINGNTGVVEISTNPNFVGLNKSENSFFTMPRNSGEIFIKDIYYSFDTGKQEMTISAPVWSTEKDALTFGVVVARIDLNNSLYKLLNNKVGLGKTGETLIVNKDLMALNELQWFENAPLNLKISAVPAMLASQGETGIVEDVDYAGNLVLAAYTHIPITNWGFVAKQNLHEINGPIRKMAIQFVLLFVFCVVVISFAALLVSRAISKPIVSMNYLAQNLKKGDFSARNNIKLKDELGELAIELNSMADVTESRVKVRKSIADITGSMLGNANMKEFCESLLQQLSKETKANMATFYILNEVTFQYEHYVSIGANEEMLSPFSAENPQGEFGNVLSSKGIYYMKDIPEKTTFKYKTVAGEAIPKEIITIPILVENAVVAIISLVNIRKFSKECAEILDESWMNINTSYSSLIASERTRILSEHLTKMNQQLEAQSEELQEQAEELQEQAEELQATSDELQEQNLLLHEQQKLVESANKLKSEFLSNMSHELRTPLNSIMALSKVLMIQAKNKLNDDENNYLEIVERNGRNLLHLINDILDLSKIEAGKMDVVVHSLSLKSLLQTVKENMQALAEKKQLELTLNVPEDLPSVETDEMRLHQVVTNVVGNALKFTSKGGVVISVVNLISKINIEIEDTGIGISEDNLPFIFEEFRQADGSTSRQFEGTGLGLAIAKKTVEILGGSISVNSEPGKGSVFTITIPVEWHEKELLKSNIPTKGSNLGKFVKSEITDLNTASMDGRKKRILIIEDNPEAIIQVKMVLERENYIVDTAGSGKEAFGMLTKNIPDGIILDLMMPEMDGFEVLEELRGTESTRNMPVLILTAKNLTKKDLAKLSANNVQQLIQKGEIDIKGLLLKVKQMFMNQKESYAKDSEEVSFPGKALPKVFLIADNEDSLIILNAILQGSCTITETLDTKIALTKIRELMPDIILLDLSLAGRSGEKYLSYFNNDDKISDIPIVAVTAQAMIGDKERFLNLGCKGYVTKPIDKELLLREIQRLVKKDLLH